jgi:hypothetical protein
MHFFNHVIYRIYRSRTKNVEITVIASLTLLRKVLNSGINIPLCWSSQLSSLRTDWHNLSVLPVRTFTALLHVSAKLYCHRQVVYIPLQRKCALGGGLSYCKQSICCCKTELLFFFLTIHFIINTNPKKYNLKKYKQKNKHTHKLTKEQQRQDNATHNAHLPHPHTANSSYLLSLYPPHANTPQRRSNFFTKTGCLKSTIL